MIQNVFGANMNEVYLCLYCFVCWPQAVSYVISLSLSLVVTDISAEHLHSLTTLKAAFI